MSDRPPLPEDFGETRPSSPPDLGRTQPSAPTPRETPPVSPPPQPHVQPHPAPPRAQGRRKRKPPHPHSESGLYLPLWSVIGMLVIVAGVAFGLVFLVVSIGGQNAPASQPRIVIITAVPSNTPALLDSALVTPTIPAVIDQGIQTPGASFALSGPTLPPVV